jgi:hypothetical protein
MGKHGIKKPDKRAQRVLTAALRRTSNTWIDPETGVKLTRSRGLREKLEAREAQAAKIAKKQAYRRRKRDKKLGRNAWTGPGGTHYNSPEAIAMREAARQKEEAAHYGEA